MPITPLYAGVLALMFVALSVGVSRVRQSTGIVLGDGGDRALLRRQRAHGNFAEYVPLGLILIALAEVGDTPAWGVHLIGTALVVGRALHSYAISREPEPMWMRVTGMALTFAVLIAGAVVNIVAFFANLASAGS